MKFLSVVKHLAENFLHLLGNDEREACVQKVFKGIMKRSPESNYKKEVSDQTKNANIATGTTDPRVEFILPK